MHQRDEDQKHPVEAEKEKLASEDEVIFERHAWRSVGLASDERRDQGGRDERERDDYPDCGPLPGAIIRVARQSAPQRVEDASNRTPERRKKGAYSGHQRPG